MFELTSGGSECIPHAFSDWRGAGAYAVSGLLALNKRLYGTTACGGQGCGKAGCGTVFVLAAQM